MSLGWDNSSNFNVQQAIAYAWGQTFVSHHTAHTTPPFTATSSGAGVTRSTLAHQALLHDTVGIRTGYPSATPLYPQVATFSKQYHEHPHTIDHYARTARLYTYTETLGNRPSCCTRSYSSFQVYKMTKERTGTATYYAGYNRLIIRVYSLICNDSAPQARLNSSARAGRLSRVRIIAKSLREQPNHLNPSSIAG